MQIDSKEYVPFKVAVEMSGRAESVFVYNASVGNVSHIDPWNGPRLYKVKDVLKLKK